MIHAAITIPSLCHNETKQSKTLKMASVSHHNGECLSKLHAWLELGASKPVETKRYRIARTGLGHHKTGRMTHSVTTITVNGMSEITTCSKTGRRKKVTFPEEEERGKKKRELGQKAFLCDH
ncbi:hypothetical protein CDAR_251571 [Caerostris darwini]|uniref:Uncharacterized protein n=1 Tax=Caerostris darwini TaxID=1538125 RepID=A0AAV4RD27_9ARAC|nr:hypothetical protein CDAR_251571 [Caerostris darwini]